MRRAISRKVNRFQHQAWSNSSAWLKLRTALLLHQAHYRCGSIEALADFVNAGRPDSGLVEKWLMGVHLISPGSAERLQQGIRMMIPVFDLAELMKPRPMTIRRIERLMSAYTQKFGNEKRWVFPTGHPRLGRETCPNSYGREDTHNLVARGDLFGFFAIVAAVRMEETDGDGIDHPVYTADMYRALPAILKIPWVAPSRQLLEECLDGLRYRMPLTMDRFRVDWNLIDRQAADPNFLPYPDSSRAWTGRPSPQNPVQYQYRTDAIRDMCRPPPLLGSLPK